MTARGPAIRVLPRLDEDNGFFWRGGADGRLRFLRCPLCRRFIHPPGPVCPYCLERGPEPDAVSGRGTVASFTVNHQQWIPGDDAYIVAWVVIDEQDDIRLTTNLVGVEPEDVVVGMRVEVEFEQVDEVYLPLFRPLADGSGAA